MLSAIHDSIWTRRRRGSNLFNPFLPTGQFMAPKLIILIKGLTDILFFQVLF